MKPKPTKNASKALKDWWAGKGEPELEATRKGFGAGLAKSKNKNIIALTANLGGSTGLGAFQKEHPERYLDVGVAEQALAGIAAGLATEGYQPVMTSFAVFSPGRNWDFIRTQIALQELPVIIAGSHAGLATGEDGATHQALEDVALMRSLPTMTIISPGDANEAIAATTEALKKKKPVYLRLTRAKTPVLLKKDFKIGKGQELIKGKNITIITTGTMLIEALGAARILWEKHKLSASVIHMPTIKPLDVNILKEHLKKKLIVTVEDHNISGGLGSSIAEYLAETKGPKLMRLGTKTFGESGTKNELYKKHGLDAKSIAEQIKKTSQKA